MCITCHLRQKENRTGTTENVSLAWSAVAIQRVYMHYTHTHTTQTAVPRKWQYWRQNLPLSLAYVWMKKQWCGMVVHPALMIHYIAHWSLNHAFPIFLGTFDT